MLYQTCLLLLISVAGVLQAPTQKANRLPLQKREIVLEAPKNYLPRLLRTDKETGEPIYYDPKPRVELVDEKSGKYAIKWIGYDGKEKTVIYQRPDAIVAVVIASISKTSVGRYLYVYKIRNLPSSGEELTSFFVQNFTSDIRPTKIAEVYVGTVSRNDKEFKNGYWIGYGVLNSSVVPGRSIEFRLESSAPPGLVECRIAGGQRGMKGVGEDMPQELENVLPGYEAWPSGYTIGPIDSLKPMPVNQRIKYIRKRLSTFQHLGWITADSKPWYRQNLRNKNLEVVYRRAEQDFQAGKITSEVLAMIKAIQL
jgi:hypothetical protein